MVEFRWGNRSSVAQQLVPETTTVMAWEKRRTGTFYYRSRRVGDRVVKVYVGRGEQGRRAAEADQAARDSRREAARLHKEKSQSVDDLIAQLDEIDRIVDQLMTCQLLRSGWRQHHREWRPPTNGRRRHNRDA